MKFKNEGIKTSSLVRGGLPRSIRLLKFFVIILGIAILSLISLMIFKITRGDLNKNSDTIIQNIQTQRNNNFKLTIPENENIISISSELDDIFILTEGVKIQRIIIISNLKDLKVIEIKKDKEISFK